MKANLLTGLLILSAPAMPLQPDPKCAEAPLGEPIRIPRLVGWVGLTNTGTAVTGMTLVLSSPDGKRQVRATTNERGQFSFPGVKPGRYRLAGAKEHYLALREDVIVDEHARGQLCLMAEACAEGECPGQ
jgi:hypothetical protein